MLHLLKYRCRLRSAGYFPGLQALGAYTLSFRRAVLNCANGLQVRQPSALCPRGTESPCSGVDVSDVLAELRAFAANITNVRHILKVLLKTLTVANAITIIS